MIYYLSLFFTHSTIAVAVVIILKIMEEVLTFSVKEDLSPHSNQSAKTRTNIKP
tara:strand:- start:178 stop:339 length:162 start_codon:yes stop_codon:yes gene_type:complete